MLKFCQTKLKVVVKLLDVKSNKHTVKLSAVRQSNEVGCMIIQCCIHMRHYCRAAKSHGKLKYVTCSVMLIIYHLTFNLYTLVNNI